MRLAILITLSMLCWYPDTARADARNLDSAQHHLRIAGPREWAEFPEAPDATHLQQTFTAQSNNTPQTLRLRQQDVKQTWRVTLNKTELGTLAPDENDLIIYFTVPPGTLRDGENVLRVEQDPKRPTPDDIRIGEIVLDSRVPDQVLAEAMIDVEVTDTDSEELLPSRLTSSTPLERCRPRERIRTITSPYVPASC